MDVTKIKKGKLCYPQYQKLILLAYIRLNKKKETELCFLCYRKIFIVLAIKYLPHHIFDILHFSLCSFELHETYILSIKLMENFVC